MIINSLTLKNFRNYNHENAEFDPHVNLIYGENAQGKTNLLEAISYLSIAKSYRTRFDRELIQIGTQSASIQGQISSRGRKFLLEACLFHGRGRQLFANGVRLKSAEELSGILTTVLFCPEDLNLIREGSTQRRKFLDVAICQLRPRYEKALTEYRRLYEHKTRILRDWKENPSLLHTLDDFNLRMAQTGAIIIHYRAHFIRRLAQRAPLIHQEFSNGLEHMELFYQTVSTIRQPLEHPTQLFPLLMEHQACHRQAELDARQCLTGPHKDDLVIKIAGQNARQFASQGQTRTATLSLKLAEREIMQEDTGEWPVLLLDDVLSELDEKRQRFVLNRIQSGQIFITCCEEEKLGRLECGRTFHIRNGKWIP